MSERPTSYEGRHRRIVCNKPIDGGKFCTQLAGHGGRCSG